MGPVVSATNVAGMRFREKPLVKLLAGNPCMLLIAKLPIVSQQLPWSPQTRLSLRMVCKSDNEIEKTTVRPFKLELVDDAVKYVTDWSKAYDSPIAVVFRLEMSTGLLKRSVIEGMFGL